MPLSDKVRLIDNVGLIDNVALMDNEMSFEITIMLLDDKLLLTLKQPTTSNIDDYRLSCNENPYQCCCYSSIDSRGDRSFGMPSSMS
jgi:hypothetical protein